MALATQCPHCFTTFRVAADQLKLRGGIVRCGACQSIFDGNAHLVDLDKPVADKVADKAASEVAGESAPAGVPSVSLPVTAQVVPDVSADVPPGVTVEVMPAPGPDATLALAVAESTPAQSTPAASTPPASVPAESTPAESTPSESTSPESTSHESTLPESASPEPGAAPPVATWRNDAPQPAWRSDAPRPAPASLSASLPASLPTSPPAAAPYGPRGRIEPSFGPPVTNDLIAEPDTGFDREDVHLPELVPKHAPARPDVVRDATADAADASGATAPAPAALVQPADDVTAEAAAHAPHAGSDDDAVPEANAEAEFHAGADVVTAPVIDTESASASDTESASESEPDSEPEPEPEPEPDDTPAAPETDHTAPAAPAAASPAEPAVPLSAALPLRASAGSDLPLSPPVLGAKTARSKALDARTRRSKLTPTKIDTAKLRVPAVDPDEPEFVRRSRRQERSTRTRRIAMGAGAAVLALGLAAQVVTEYRNVLAARYPAAKPVLGAACALLGCRVTLPAQVDTLAIDTGELTTLGPNTYALTTQLRNEGALVQAWPSIELELIDADDKPVLRRVFGPADYLPPGALATAGFGPRAEQAVKLHFALADLKPAGYHTFVFYP